MGALAICRRTHALQAQHKRLHRPILPTSLAQIAAQRDLVLAFILLTDLIQSESIPIRSQHAQHAISKQLQRLIRLRHIQHAHRRNGWIRTIADQIELHTWKGRHHVVEHGRVDLLAPLLSQRRQQ